jgi:hypothetical protein
MDKDFTIKLIAIAIPFMLGLAFLLPNLMIPQGTYQGSYNERQTLPHDVPLTGTTLIQDQIENFLIRQSYDSNIYQSITYANPYTENMDSTYSINHVDTSGSLASLMKGNLGTYSLTASYDSYPTSAFYIASGTLTEGNLASLEFDDEDALTYKPNAAFVEGPNLSYTDIISNPQRNAFSMYQWTHGDNVCGVGQSLTYDFTISESSYRTRVLDPTVYGTCKAGGYAVGEPFNIPYSLDVYPNTPYEPVTNLKSQDGDLHIQYDAVPSEMFPSRILYFQIPPAGMTDLLVSGIDPKIHIRMRAYNTVYGSNPSIYISGVVQKYSDNWINEYSYEVSSYYYDSDYTLGDFTIPSTNEWVDLFFDWQYGWAENNWRYLFLDCSPYLSYPHNGCWGDDSNSMYKESTKLDIDTVEVIWPVRYLQSVDVQVPYYVNNVFHFEMRSLSRISEVLTYTNQYPTYTSLWRFSVANLLYYSAAYPIYLELQYHNFVVVRINNSPYPDGYPTYLPTDLVINAQFQAHWYIFSSQLDLNVERTHVDHINLKPICPEWSTLRVDTVYNVGSPTTTTIDANPSTFATIEYADANIDHISVIAEAYEAINPYPIINHMEMMEIYCLDPDIVRIINFQVNNDAIQIHNDVRVNCRYTSNIPFSLYINSHLYAMPTHPSNTVEYINEQFSGIMDIQIRFMASSDAALITLDDLFIDVIYEPIQTMNLQNFLYHTNGIDYYQTLPASLDNVINTDWTITLEYGISSSQLTYYVHSTDLYIPDQFLSYQVVMEPGISLTASCFTITLPSVTVIPAASTLNLNYGDDYQIVFHLNDAQSLYYSLYFDGELISGHILQPISNYHEDVSVWIHEVGGPFTASHTFECVVTDGVEDYDSGLTTVNFATNTPTIPTILTVNQTIFGESLGIEWTTSTFATSYKVYYNNTLNHTTALTTDMITIPYNTRVNIQVTGVNAWAESSKSNSCGLRFINKLPSQTQFITTNQTVTDISSFALTWPYNDFAEGYYIYWNTTLTHNIMDNQITTTNGLFPAINGFYEVMVIAYNRFGNATASNKIGITLALLPEKPTFITVNQTIINNASITLIWHPSMNALNYTLFLNGTEYLKTTNTTYLYTLPVNSTELNFRLLASNELGNSSLSNTLKIISTIYIPFPFTLLTNNQTNNGTFNLTWNPSQYALSYMVYANNSIIRYVSNTSILIQMYNQGLWQLKIGAINNYGITYSNEITINVSFWLPSKPLFLNTSQTLGFSVFSLNFTSTNATLYHIFVNGLLNRTTMDNWTVYNLPFLNAVYEFRIIAENSYGNSTISDLLQIKIIVSVPIKPIITDGHSHADNSIAITWGNVEFTDLYYVLVNHQTKLTTTDLQATMSFPAVNQTYAFSVIANNFAGNSTESEIMNVNIVVYTPNTPIMITASQTVKGPLNFTLSWEAVNNAQGYYILANGSLRDITSLTQTTLILSLGTHLLAVIAYNNIGNSSAATITVIVTPLENATAKEAPTSAMATWGWIPIGAAGLTIIGVIIYEMRKENILNT